jgi:D-lyxose ketol-isomerase
MREADKFIRSFGYILPPFAYWSPKEFRDRKAEAGMIVERNCGWDITDYGLNEFDKTGLFLFTVRNGNNADLAKGRGMLYAEKAMISRNEQYSPMHRHNLKDGKCDRHKGVEVNCDGILHKLPPGGKLRLKPGESVTLMPNEHWHAFWGEGGDVFIGEVSTVNDDNTDNVFDDPRIARFGGIEEDEEPWHLLVSDYARWLA